MKELLNNAENTTEAVSALFFLQNGLIEKETRKQEKFNYYRLFFGQTFASIKEFWGSLQLVRKRKRLFTDWWI